MPRPDGEEIAYLSALVELGVQALYADPPPDASEGELAVWAMWTATDVNHLAIHVDATKSVEGREISEEERVGWLLPLAWGIAGRWKLRGGEWDALRRYLESREPLEGEERDTDSEGGKVAFLMDGILRVQTHRKEPTAIRLGGKWITTPEGRKAEVIPGTLPWLHYLRWFVSRAIGEARALLKDEAPSEGVSLDKVPEPSAADLYTEWERVGEIYAAARDGLDLRLLDALSEGLSVTDFAKEEGVPIQTAHTRLRRLKKRISGG